MLDWAHARGLGFSHFVSLGDAADIGFADMLDWLAADAGTEAVLMYVESVQEGGRFLRAARAAAGAKPVIVVKAGRAPEGARAAASHTGALAGSDLVFDAAVRRAGLLRVATLEELFDAAETLARARPLAGDGLTLLTNGGGAGVLAADALALGGGRLAELSGATRAALDAVLPPTWSGGNPVDIVGDAPLARYTAALRVLLAAPETEALLLLQAPTAVAPSVDVARACLPLLTASSKPVLTCWMGGSAAAPARAACRAAGLPSYDTPERAVAAFLHLVQHRRARLALRDGPTTASAAAADTAAARALLDRAAAEGRELLDEAAAKALLAAYGLPVVDTRVAADAEAALAAAAQIGYPVVLKILSPQLSHKSDVGGVALDLATPEALRAAAAAMLARVGRLRPDAHITGFTVQAMVRRPHAHELIVGIAPDAVFGPVVLFGQGGTAVEVVQDRAVALPPLDAAGAADLVDRTRISRLLAGYRDRSAVDRAALHAALVQVARMAVELPQLAELDINPLLADAQGVLALDARVRLRPPPRPA
jgi:acetyltransferase